MNLEQSKTLTALAREHASDLLAVTPVDFDAIADRINSQTVNRPRGKVGTKTVILTLGARSEAMLTAFEMSAVGRRGLQMLSDQAIGGGLDFADPLTVMQINGLAAAKAITEDDAAKLLGLGYYTTSIAADAGFEALTADELQTALEAVALAARITNATALASERMTTSQTDAERESVWSQAWKDAI